MEIVASDSTPDPVDFIADWIAREEGGVADVGDGAGLTRWGQTAGWCEGWGLPIPMTREQAHANTVRWMALTHLDAICGAVSSPTLPLVVADYAFNSGEPPAIKAFQAALGVTPDGVIGQVTLAALRAVSERHLSLALLVLSARQARNGGIVSAHPDPYARFAKNWSDRYARQMRRIAGEIAPA